MRRQGSAAWEIAAAGLLFAACATALNGLVWGVGDHDIIAAFHGERLAGDLLTNARDAHPSVLWWLVGGQGGAAWNALHVAALVLTGALLFLLGRALISWRAGAWLVLPLLAPSIELLGGAPLVDPLLLPRGMALPLELGLVLAAVHGRWRLAWLLAGAAIAVHAPSRVAVTSGLALAWWPDRRAWTDVGPAVVALPVVAAGGPAGRLAPMDPAWWSLVELRLAHHLAPSAWSPWIWLSAGACLLAALALREPRTRRAGLGLAGWMLVGGALAALRVPLAVNLEPWQGARLLAVAGALGLVAWVGGDGRRAAVPIVLAGLLWCAADRPRFLPAGPDGDLADLARWARTETPDDALFLIPPDLVGFRALARRPVFGTVKDGGELQFDRDLALEWRRRMELLCDCDVLEEVPEERRPGDRRRALTARVAAGYAGNEGLVEVARGAGVSWVVRRVGAILPTLDGAQASARFGDLAVYPVRAEE